MGPTTPPPAAQERNTQITNEVPTDAVKKDGCSEGGNGCYEGEGCLLLRWTQTWSERISDGFPEEMRFRLWEICMCICSMQGKALWTRGGPQNSILGTNENPRAGHLPAGPSTGLTPSVSPTIHTE